MTPCIAQVTTLSTTFAEDVANYFACGCTRMEVWLTKLEQHLLEESVDRTRQMVADAGLALVAAAYQGGLLQAPSAARAAHFDHFRRRLDLCQTIGIPTLVIGADLGRALDAAAWEWAVAALVEAGRWAAAFNIRLALEFRGTDPGCASLETALALVGACRQTNVGLCLDIFEYYKGPSKLEDIDRLTPANLFHVQVSDVAGIPREWMTDADRVMPGDGDFRLDLLIGKLHELGYDGSLALELMNPVLWRSDPRQVIELGLSALERQLAPIAGRRSPTRD